MEIKLYVHGVPKGRVIWGAQENECTYLESFYGYKTNIDALLFVETIQKHDVSYCYYTYGRYGNILDYDNRSGGYFALTIRVDKYYADLVNMYNLLDAAYNKFIVSRIIEKNETVLKFKVIDFKQEDSFLRKLEKEIIHYLEQFSDDSDFIPLNDFSKNHSSETKSINLLECNIPTLTTYLKKNGKIIISPFFPSAQLVDCIRNKEFEIKKVREDAQQEIAEIKREKEEGVKKIELKYVHINERIDKLQREKDEANSRAVDYKNKWEKVCEKMKLSQDLKITYDDIAKAIERLSQIIPIKNPESQIIVSEWPTVSNKIKGNDLDDKLSKWEKMKWWVIIASVIGLFIAIVLLINLFIK